MDTVKYLLIGGGVGTFNAAKRIRKADPGARILLVSDERIPPYDLPPLSKEFLRGVKSEADITYESPEALRESGVDLKLSTRVVKLDAGKRVAELDNGEQVQYEKAFISTGARVVKLPVPGADLPGVHYLRTVDDTVGLSKDCLPGRKAVIIGAGFIGLEAAASMVKLGMDVTVVEAMPRIWPRFADEMLASHVQTFLEKNGVKFRLGEMVSELRGGVRVETVLTASGSSIPADVVCVGIGVRPNIELAQEAGLKIDNGIWVDDHMRTSDPNIYAGGDVVNYPDPITGKRRRAEHWGHAEYCGQIAGMNMSGGDSKYDFVSYVWSDIFDMHLEAAGDEAEYDEIVLRGEMESGSFLMLYLHNGHLSAYTSVNSDPKEFTTLRRLIRGKQNLAARVDELKNPEINLRTFL